MDSFTLILVIASVLTFVLPWFFAFRGRGGVRVPRNAPIGIGTVVWVRRTGLTVNDRPQLEIQLDVDTADGHRFRGVARALVDLTELGMVAPGATLPVRYRQDGKVALATDASQAELQSVMNRVQLARGHIDAQGLRIAEHGVD